jgi:hypothetical protein
MLGSFSSIERGSILLHSPIKSFAKSSGSLGARRCGFYASSSIIAIVRGFRSSRALQLVAAQDYLALAIMGEQTARSTSRSLRAFTGMPGLHKLRFKALRQHVGPRWWSQIA